MTLQKQKKAKRSGFDNAIQLVKSSWNGLVQHPLLFMLFIVILLLLVKENFTSFAISQLGLDPVTVSSTYMSLIATLVGAGIFSTVMKTAQFSDLFKKQLYSVVYQPDESSVISDEMLDHGWKTLTRIKLENILPQSIVNDANESMHNLFFNSHSDYHFEKYDVEYEICKIEGDDDCVLVKQYTKTTIKIAPFAERPMLNQIINTGDDHAIINLWLNNQHIISSEEGINSPLVKRVERVVENDNQYVLAVNLNEFTEGENSVELKKSVQFKQNLTKEPYFLAAMRRFTKGATVKVKITDDFKLFFKLTGPNAATKSLDPIEIMGARIWTLADDQTLLLPGHGYILMVFKCSM
ncbi:hypothetical protein HUO09_17715 [Vibrio sp. Y2-5]|uniref:hypothetical protein n=1 Tax=Vibrio sp. Y2-5 TaxID=2743977 RepID=UPI0016612048|nr:hypothetical protein [Vibrio sp. Y2-5]MBD0788196.1 hypothetical protein [Vibrio sp. Y2-5]